MQYSAAREEKPSRVRENVLCSALSGPLNARYLLFSPTLFVLIVEMPSAYGAFIYLSNQVPLHQ